MSIDAGPAHLRPHRAPIALEARQRLAVVSMSVATTSIVVATSTTRRRRRAAAITLAGEVDLAALGRLREVMAAASVCHQVTIEASEVDFIDCCALAPMLSCATAITAKGGTLCVCAPSPALADLITWCHLEDRLPTLCAPTRRTPAAALGGALGGAGATTRPAWAMTA